MANITADAAWQVPKLEMYRGSYQEEILETINDRAAITRSPYGYRVLNTPDLCFIDIDYVTGYAFDPQANKVLRTLREWVNDDLSLQTCWRVYRTAAGMRLMRTDAPESPNANFDMLCSFVCADQLYRDLCHEQKTYRARLTPKPRRVGITMPTWNYYWAETQGRMNEYDTKRLPKMIEAYELLAADYKTCELLEVVGNGFIHPDLKPLVEIHDRICKVADDLPLEELTSEESWKKIPMIDIINFHLAYRFNAKTQESSNHTPDAIWAVLSYDVKYALKPLDEGGLAAIKYAQNEDRRLKKLCFDV